MTYIIQQAGSDVGHRIVSDNGINGGIPDPMWTRPVDPIINSGRHPRSYADPAYEPHSENRGAPISLKWIRDPVGEATYRADQ